MKPHSMYKLLGLSTLFASFLLAGCEPGWDTGDGGSATPTPETPGDLDPTFVGPGSSWRLEMDDETSTFTLTKREQPSTDSELVVDVGGDYEELSSGFLRFTVNSISSGDSVDNNAQFVAIIAGDAVVIAEPVERDDSNQKLMVNADSCPSIKSTSNWVIYKQAEDFDSSEETAYHYGTFEFSTLHSTTSFITYSLDESVEGSTEVGETTEGCDEGIASNENTRHYLTLAPNAISERGATQEEFEAGNTANAQFTLAVAQRSIAATSDFDGDFIGFYADSAASNDRRQFPVKANCVDGSCTLTEMTDVSDGTLANDNYILSFDNESINAPATGMVIGTLTAPNETAENRLLCSINTDYDPNDNNGQAFFACVGKVPGNDNFTNFINIFLVTE